jgi:hypothetical protein
MRLRRSDSRAADTRTTPTRYRRESLLILVPSGSDGVAICNRVFVPGVSGCHPSHAGDERPLFVEAVA